MTKITISQTDESTVSPFNAAVQFDNGPRYPITVSDPFSEEEEDRLQWYFEGWLGFPFTGQVKAGQAAASVADYGRRLFAQVFRDNPDVLAEYKMAMRYEKGFAGLEFEIRGTPAFHALHWEALWDPANGRPFAAECAFYRQNDNPPAFHIRQQPSPTLNVLLVTARPRGRQDVGYRTISRPLVDALHNSALRTQIDIVRPGSYAALVRHLERSRDRHGDGYYHIIHFDVHGSLLTFEQYQKLETAVSPHLFKGGYGQPEITPYDGLRAFLSFNGAAAGEHDLVADEVIAGLLQSHQIPIAILNACQSGMQVGDSETSLGSRLMAAGVQTAVAMAYSVTVSAARLLMTHLYQHLLAGLPLPQAIRRARLELLNVKERRAAYNQTIELEDWLLPVVYQNQPVALPITDFASAAEEEAYLERQSRRYRAPKPTYGFVGRDVDILEMETRLLAGDDGDPTAVGPAANVLLLQGMGGAGKTTLLKHLMEWWQTTRLVARVFYFGYDEKAYTTGQILDGIARELYGAEYGRLFSPLSDAAKQQKLVAALRSERHLLVLDNLESITGAALAIQHTLDAAEQDRLRDFVARLAGGQTLVLLGSRGPEEWLVGAIGNLPQIAQPQVGNLRYELPGLDPEAASALAQRILNGLGLRDLPADPAQGNAFRQLLKLLDGYPLALEIVLANLARQTAADLLAAFSGGDAGIDAAAGGDLWQDKTKSLLRCIEYSHSNLSADAQALLACLAPFTGVFNANLLPQYTAQLKAQPALAGLPYERWQEVLTEALNWGLLTPHEIGGGYLRLQPILPYFLRQRLTAPSPAGEGWGEGDAVAGVPPSRLLTAIESAFRAHYDGVGRALAGLLTSKQPQERQLGQTLTNLEYENLMTALKLALAQKQPFWNIYSSLAAYLRSRQGFREEKAICELILAAQDQYPPQAVAGEIGGDFFMVYGNLGTHNLALKLYDDARQTYESALQLIPQLEAIPQEQRGLWSATAYHQLGRVAQEQRQWETAVAHYNQALALKIEFNDRYSQASTYHQLGYVAQEQRQWETAVAHYNQALALFIEFNDRYSQAKTLHALGAVMQEQKQFSEAQNYYQQALALYIEFNDRHLQAMAYHQLGNVAQEQRQWETAVAHYNQALAIYIEFNDRYEQAGTYHQLGIVAQEQRQWETAVAHYNQALAIYIEFNDRYSQGSTINQLGAVFQLQEQWAEAANYYLQAIQIAVDFQDNYRNKSRTENLAQVWQAAPDFAGKPDIPGKLAAILSIPPAQALALLQPA